MLDADPEALQVGGDHYKKMLIQPAEFCYRNGFNNLQSEAISYISRYALKWPGDLPAQIVDLEKAVHTLQILLKYLRIEKERETECPKT